MSRKTSTAALDSFRRKPLHPVRRVPRHPAGARTTDGRRSNQRLNGLMQFQQARLVIFQENTMNMRNSKQQAQAIRTILPVILRITLSLVLWTLGAASMNLAAAQTDEHHAMRKFAVDRAQVEALQRWVNAGHDPWCRDSQLVAAAALRRFSPEEMDIEPTSLLLESQDGGRTVATYSFHSLDGRFTYRVTLRRFDWLLPVAGSLDQMIWVPEHAEIITQDMPTKSQHPQHFDNKAV